MPMYICNASKGVIAEQTKSELAADITRIHCEMTEAPPEFVHVFFFEEARNPPLSERKVAVACNIRAGRTDAQKAEIITRIQHSLRARCGVQPDQTRITTSDTPANWVMEGGDIMPEPGDEADWMVAHEAKRSAGAERSAGD